VRLLWSDIVQPGEHCHVHTRRIAAPLAQAAHDHDFCEVFWVDEGRGVHLVNGQRRTLEAGLLFLVRPDDAHGFTVEPGQAFRLVNVAFSSATWRDLTGRYGHGDLLGEPLDARELRLEADGTRELGLVANELLGGARSRMAIERFLLNLFYLIDVRQNAATPPGAPPWLAAACVAIRNPKHFAKGPSALVRLSGRTPEHVAREARRWLGKTPTDIVNDARAAHAAARLAETDGPILDIALECGLENISHFYRLFRARYGATPGQYRRRHQRVLG
jgi:AraC family transcriptional regulator, dual regulator of chb operon